MFTFVETLRAPAGKRTGGGGNSSISSAGSPRSISSVSSPSSSLTPLEASLQLPTFVFCSRGFFIAPTTDSLELFKAELCVEGLENKVVGVNEDEESCWMFEDRWSRRRLQGREARITTHLTLFPMLVTDLFTAH